MKTKHIYSKLLGLAVVTVVSLTIIKARANYWGYNGIVQNQTWQVEARPNIVADHTYWAIVSVSSIGGYGGMQQNTSTDRRGLFSLWDSTGTNLDAFVYGFNPYLTWLGDSSFRFGGEGAGSQLLFQWNWTVGNTYRMAWRRFIVPGSSLVTYEGWIYDPYNASIGGWAWVGSLQRPQSTSDEQNINGFEGFSEDWAGTGGIRDISIRNVWLLNLSNNWQNISHARMDDNRDEGFLTAIAGGWKHHSYDTNYSYVYQADLPMLSDSTLAPVCLPYHINCGLNIRSNTVTAKQMASSLSRAFEPDAFWSGTSTNQTTTTTVTVSGVSNAAPAGLYLTRREGTNFGYTLFGLQTNVTHQVLLHFSEPTYNTTGSRKFKVVINGTTVETSLDIRSVAGAINKAVVRSYTVTPTTNGLITIAFTTLSGTVPALVCGIEATPTGLPNGIYKIAARNSGLLLDVTYGTITNGSRVEQWTDNGGGGNQRWTLTALGSGQYKIIGVASGRAMEVSGSSTADGANVDIWDYTGSNNAIWTLTPTDSGFYKAINVNSSKSLDVTGGSTSAGAYIEQWTPTGGNNQQWSFTQ